MEPIKLFVLPQFDPTKPDEDVRLLRTGSQMQTSLLYKRIPRDFRYTSFSIVDSAAIADYVLLPQRMRRDTPEWRRYFEMQKKYARELGKPLILVIGTDLSHTMHVENAIAFKGSEYRHGIHSNEIVMPPFSEDLSEVISFSPRQKSEKPIVSFCGYAGFPDAKTRIKYLIKNIALELASYVSFRPHLRACKRGIYYRRVSISALQKNDRVETHFIIRNSFSANMTTSNIDPDRARAEYIENMNNSDFVLAPRGDGNSSVRFYEALSLGRIPILIDTDMMLPLENIIDYSKFILRVPHTEIRHLGDIVADFYDSLTDEQFQAMQTAARDAFQKYLRFDAFFNTALPLLKDKGLAAFR